ncbi:AAA family ATPase [Arthrobacter sp. TMS1-12-1]
MEDHSIPHPLPVPVVHLLCGLNGAGKTTLARELEDEIPAVRFTLDEWMLRCFPDLAFDSDEYGRKAEECKDLMWEVALQVLRTGSDVILDWNQWNRQRRAFWRDRAVQAGYSMCLHYIRGSVEVAVEQAEKRVALNAPWVHPLTAAQIRQFTELFEEPTNDEGIPIIVS